MCVCVCICVCVKPLHLRLFMFVPQRLQLLMCRLVLYKSGRVLLDEPVMPGEPVDSTGLCIRQTEISTTNHMKTIVPYHPRHESTPTTRNHTPTTRKLHMTQLLCRDIAAAHSQNTVSCTPNCTSSSSKRSPSLLCCLHSVCIWFAFGLHFVCLSQPLLKSLASAVPNCKVPSYPYGMVGAHWQYVSARVNTSCVSMYYFCI